MIEEDEEDVENHSKEKEKHDRDDRDDSDVGDDERDENDEDEERPNLNQVKYKVVSSEKKTTTPFPQQGNLSRRYCQQFGRFVLDICREVWRSLSPTNLIHIGGVVKKSFMILFVAKTTWSMGIYYLMVGLFFAFLSEIISGPKYNSIFLLALMASIAFSQFPTNSVRPQLVVTLLACLTLALDIQALIKSPRIINPACKTFIAISILAKMLALYDFLWFSNGSTRARKYLIRRIRVFSIPLTRPRRVMKEIRSRILALEWIQFVGMVSYFTLFIASISTAGFSSIMISPKVGLPLFVFFPIKSLLSAIIFFAFVADTDMILCLAYFGCLGWNMKYVKVYIHKKREENGGWPLPYGLNPYRFYVICALKFVDVCWGFGGWVTIGTTFGENLNDRVIAITSATTVLLVITDIWCPILFYVVYDLLNLYKRELEYYEKNNETMESDDSELDEFNIRNDENAIAKARKSRRKGSKRRIRIESSDVDDESSESDSPKSTHRHTKRKSSHTNSGSPKFSTVLQSNYDRDESRSNHQVHITLQMALGSPDDEVDDNSSDENQNESPLPSERRRNSQSLPLAHGNQFTTSRRTSNDIQSPTKVSNSIQTAPFSPGQGDWSQANLNAASLPRRPNLRRTTMSSPLPTKVLPPRHIILSSPYPDQSGGEDEEKTTQVNPNVTHPTHPLSNPAAVMISHTYRDHYGDENTIVIDESTSISPDRFTELWESLEPSASFGSLLVPEPNSDQKLIQIVEHLHHNYFYIVAAGQVESIVTIYGFISGYNKRQQDDEINDVYFLLELKVNLHSLIAAAAAESQASCWSFECICKCTNPEVSPIFIQMMYLGDILQQHYSNEGIVGS